MEYEESVARVLGFIPVIRDVFADAPPTVEGRERVMQRHNVSVGGTSSHASGCAERRTGAAP
jgi:hypothetical protein